MGSCPDTDINPKNYLDIPPPTHHHSFFRNLPLCIFVALLNSARNRETGDRFSETTNFFLRLSWHEID